MKKEIVSKKNIYDTKIAAIKYLLKNSVYTNEWSGAGMYEAIVKVVDSPKGTRFRKIFLNSLLDNASKH